MIDFHTHILPHFDDGAKDTAMATAMLESEVRQGVTDVLLTSHFYGKKHSPDRFLEKRNAAWARLKPKAPEGLNVHLAAEVHFTGVNVLAYDELCKLAIADTKYILIEFPFTEKWSVGVLSALSTFIDETGYTPIIAHVERYREIKKKPALINELLAMGCLLQVNTSAFLNKREKSLALALLRREAIHCIGTDAHDMSIRKPNLKEVKAELEAQGFVEAWEKIQTTMRMVLRGEEVKPQPIKPIKHVFGKYF
jgi:protein-tyrosine phosphatase